MRKILRIISISAGIISVVSALVLVCIYLEDIGGYIKKVKSKIIKKIIVQKQMGDEKLILNERSDGIL